MSTANLQPPRRQVWRLTRKRLDAAADYVTGHLSHSIGGAPMVADRYETPRAVVRTMTRIYGSPRIPGDGETAYWRIDDNGARLGLSL